MVKIYYNGKRVRDNEGRFSSLKKQIKRGFRLSMWLVVMFGAFFATYKLGQYTQPQEIFQARVEAEVRDTLQEKIGVMKGEVLDTLQKCESQNISEETGLITFDPHPTNKKVQVASIGQYQFKVSTLQYHYKNFYNKELTGKEAIELALDTKQARDLAEKIIFETEKSTAEWFNCAKNHNLQPKVNLIKELSK